MTITQEQLAEWRALADAATPGECGWYVIHWNAQTGYAVAADTKDGNRVIIAIADFGGKAVLRNMKFSAAARTAVPALLAEVQRLQAEINEWMALEARTDARAVQLATERDELRRQLAAVA